MQAQAALSQAQIELASGRLADIGTGLGRTTGEYVALGAQQTRLQSIKDSTAMPEPRHASRPPLRGSTPCAAPLRASCRC